MWACPSFRQRPAFGHLPPTLRRDRKVFFGAYAEACAQADALLFQAGDPACIDAACQRSPVGKLLPDDLYVHRDTLPYLAPLLRIYEGGGRSYLGELTGRTSSRSTGARGNSPTWSTRISRPTRTRPWRGV
jgi:DNA phosphorothioation-associated putative methyltransferase